MHLSGRGVTIMGDLLSKPASGSYEKRNLYPWLRRRGILDHALLHLGQAFVHEEVKIRRRRDILER